MYNPVSEKMARLATLPQELKEEALRYFSLEELRRACTIPELQSVCSDPLTWINAMRYREDISPLCHEGLPVCREIKFWKLWQSRFNVTNDDLVRILLQEKLYETLLHIIPAYRSSGRHLRNISDQCITPFLPYIPKAYLVNKIDGWLHEGNQSLILRALDIVDPPPWFFIASLAMGRNRVADALVSLGMVDLRQEMAKAAPPIAQVIRRRYAYT